MADPLRFLVPDAAEQKSGIYTAQLRDENNAPISVNALTSFTLSLYDQASGAFINGRQAQNVLNANQVTVDTSGNVTWVWLPADMTFVNPGKQQETHIALFEAKWLDGASRPRELPHEVWFTVGRIVNNT